ncbi:MAG: SagB family peptide dehydrogenase [Sedimentisphaerales bacterium]
MKKIFLILLLFSNFAPAQPPAVEPVITTIRLPEPDLNGKISLEQAIENRRSIRQFTAEPLTVKQVGQLCWSAQGITEPNKGLRAAPSAGALYPMELYVVLSDGLYLYSPKTHSLEKQIDGDIRSMLRTAAFGQKTVQDSPCTFIIAGSIKKIEAKYRGRSERFACLEAGHIAENISLQAVALGLGSVPIGSFAPKSVAGVCRISEDLEVLYLVCTGNPVAKPVLETAVAAAPLLPSPAQSADDIRTKRVVVVVPDKFFVDKEYFGVVDSFQLVGIQPIIASSITGDIKGLERNTITATMLIRDIKIDDFDAFVFLGGPSASTSNYFNDTNVLNLVRAANKEQKILAAIGTAPVIFAYADVIKGRKIAAALSKRKNILISGGEWKSSSLEIDYNMITSNGPEASNSVTGSSDIAQRFGSAIVNMLRHPELTRPSPGGTAPVEKKLPGTQRMY